MSDVFHLERFVLAQNPVLDKVRAELRRGRKSSHWMWFIFPQIRGLGSSPTAVQFAIDSAAEAKAYLRHPILGERLIECSQLVLDVKGASLEQIFGFPDHLKFHSSMTLFAAVAPPEQPVFDRALSTFWGGQKDSATIARLAGPHS